VTVKETDMASVPDDLAPIRDAALPNDAPGAWIRAAIDALFTPGAPSDHQRMIDEEEDWA
jgi:hypothetical protein